MNLDGTELTEITGTPDISVVHVQSDLGIQLYGDDVFVGIVYGPGSPGRAYRISVLTSGGLIEYP